MRVKKIALAGVGVLALTASTRVLFWSDSAAGAASGEGVAPVPERPARTVAADPEATPERLAERVRSTAAPPALAPLPPPAVQEAREAPSPEPSRRRRRWNYNRYPGPIPTPEEWRAPEGPVRIGLQVGHWRTDEAPGELSGLRRNGASWNGLAEWEVNLEIARRTAALLEELGYAVDVLPAVVPPGYRAHLFLAIHADASDDHGVGGYRVAAPRRDATGRASGIVDLLGRTYGPATGIRRLPNATRRMRNYYAFNFRRYEHALHPMTIAAIIETGFLTNAADREIIVSAPERAARGIVEAIVSFPVTPPPVRADGAP